MACALAAVVVLAGLVSGARSAALIALVNTVLNRRLQTSSWVLGAFIALTLAKIGSNVLAHLALENFSQGTLAALCRGLARRVLKDATAAPGEQGAPRLLTGLVDDVAAIGLAIRKGQHSRHQPCHPGRLLGVSGLAVLASP